MSRQSNRILKITQSIFLLVIFLIFYPKVLSQSDIEVVIDSKNVEMIYVPPGEFVMGNSLDEALAFCLSLYEEQDKCSMEEMINFNLVNQNQVVEVGGFYMDRYEVSLASYLDCVNADVCTIMSIENDYYSYLENPNIQIDLPVSGVTYYDAAVYCAWRESRLPTEAEWEYAAVGEDQNPFPWDSNNNEIPANYCDANCPINPDLRMSDGYELFAPVTSFVDGQSWAGIVNLSGNAAEWTSSRLLTGEGIANDIRLVKGGSYLSPIHELVVWMRIPTGANIARNNGFRCVRTTYP